MWKQYRSNAICSPLIGDVGGDLRDPVQDREQGKVSFEVRVHLGAVEHGLGIFPVGHLLLRERGTEDIRVLATGSASEFRSQKRHPTPLASLL